MDPIIAVNTMAFQGHDLSVALSEIAGLGATHVELCFTKGYVEGLSEEYFSEKNANSVRQLITDEGLQTIAMAGHIDLGEAQAVEALKRRIDFTKVMGAKMVHTNATQKFNQDIFFRNMEALADFAEEMDMIIALENPGDGEHALIDTGEAGARVVKKIGSDRIRLNYDPSNVYSYTKGKIKPEKDILHAIPHVVHFHFKDMKQIEDGWLFSEIGKGVVNYHDIFITLKNQPEPLPTSIEFPKNFRRKEDFSPMKHPNPPELPEVRNIIKGSLEFIENGLRQS